MYSQYDSKIIVVGAGMSGLVASVRAQQLGAEVVLIEKSAATGGTMAMSGGSIWCPTSFEGLLELVPRCEKNLGRILVKEFPNSVSWLASIGTKFTTTESNIKTVNRTVHQLEPDSTFFANHMKQIFIKNGGEVLLETSGHSLIQDPNGQVIGLESLTPKGTVHTFGKAVILATGGFQGNPELLARYMGEWSDRLILRAGTHSTGDGLTMAKQIGAIPSRSMNHFYGHLMPAPPAKIDPGDFVKFTHYHSTESVLLNLMGERYVDESISDEVNAQATLRQPQALCYMIFDSNIHNRYGIREITDQVHFDIFEESKKIGAITASDHTLPGLIALLNKTDLYGQGALSTLMSYQIAAENSQTRSLRIPNKNDSNPLSTPPFMAVSLTQGITFTMGGLETDHYGRVISKSRRTINGLYAVGADAGGIYSERYGGGLSLGLVFGKRSAEHAVSLKK